MHSIYWVNKIPHPNNPIYEHFTQNCMKCQNMGMIFFFGSINSSHQMWILSRLKKHTKKSVPKKVEVLSFCQTRTIGIMTHFYVKIMKSRFLRENNYNLRKCMVKAPHCTEEAWKFPLSTWRYLVLTVCERNRLNKATFVPLATQTVKIKSNNH